MSLVNVYSSKFANASGESVNILEQNYNDAKLTLDSINGSLVALQVEIDNLQSQKNSEELKRQSCSGVSCASIVGKISALNSLIVLKQSNLSSLTSDKLEQETLVSSLYNAWQSYLSSPLEEQSRLTQKALSDAEKIKQDKIKAENDLKNQIKESEKSFEQKIEEQKQKSKNTLMIVGGVAAIGIVGLLFFKRK